MTTTLKRRTQRRTDDGVYQRNYKWNERNLLSESSDSSYTVQYRYGADGQRAIKYVLNTGKSTLYFNRMWQTNDTREAPVQSKHIYMGETRIATKNSATDNPNTLDESKRIYYYHSDHLGSARTVTNYKGDVHERLEYTPYGELWIDWKSSTDGDKTPFRFTGKERDEETGLYYYGARYMDPRTSRWLTTDPAMYQGDYIPSAPVNDEARKRNGNLPGEGGIFNVINMHVYHYAGNNPVKYIDPTGRDHDGFYLACDTGKNVLDIWGNARGEPTVERARAMTNSSLKIIDNIKNSFNEHLFIVVLFECGILIYGESGLFKDIVDTFFNVLNNKYEIIFYTNKTYINVFDNKFGMGFYTCKTENTYTIGLGFSSGDNSFSIISKNTFDFYLSNNSKSGFNIGLDFNCTFSGGLNISDFFVGRISFGFWAKF